MRSRLAVLLIAVSLAVLAYVVFGGSDEDEIVARVKELASAVETRDGESIVFRTARIDKVFKAALEPEASFDAPELPPASGSRALALLAAEAGANYGTIRLGVGATDVHVEGPRARAVSEITLTSARGNELHGDRRSVRFELDKVSGSWRVRSISVAHKGGEQPEARP